MTVGRTPNVSLRLVRPSYDALVPLLGRRICGRANAGPAGIYGGVPFEGELVGLADTPQALVRQADGHVHAYSISCMADIVEEP